MKAFLFALTALGVVAFVGCGKKSDQATESREHGPGHVHVAPHGGTLIELGEHAYNLELLRERATGKLTAWVLDGHAENFVRIASTSFQLIAMPGGKYTPLAMQAVGNPATGETVGDTSQFEVQTDWLKTADAFSGIFTVEIQGTKFEQVAYGLPE